MRKILFATIFSLNAFVASHVGAAEDYGFWDIYQRGTTKEMLKEIKQSKDIEELNSALLGAVWGFAPVEVVTELIRAGAQVNQKGEGDDGDEFSCVVTAIGSYRFPDKDVVALLLKAGAKLDANEVIVVPYEPYESEEEGEGEEYFEEDHRPLPKNITVLMRFAWTSDDPAMIKSLINRNTKINATDSDGWTALTYAAAFNSNPEIIKILLDAGADPKIKDKKGKTAVDYAKDNDDLKNSAVFSK